jgi:FtsP/CotA-like multicopper oxidase with cupredoxin domain
VLVRRLRGHRRRSIRLTALPIALALLALGGFAVRGVVQNASAQGPGAGGGTGCGPGSGNGHGGGPGSGTGAACGSGTGSSSPQGQTPIYVPSTSGGELLQPPVIASRHGVLKATDTAIRAGIPGSGRSVLWGGLPTYSSPLVPPTTPQASPYPGGPPGAPPHFPLNFAAGFQFTAYGKAYPAQFPGPTLRVNPGDTLDLTTVDKLQIGKLNYKLPALATEMNLHTHGLSTSPLGDGDNIYRTMAPNSTSQSSIKITDADGSGFDWYHLHKHGYVSDQVYSGLAGMLQVGDPLDPWPQYKGKYQEKVLGLTGAIVLTDGCGEPEPANQCPQGQRYLEDPSPGAVFSGKPANPYGEAWQKYVNGQFNPTITVRPGETQIWTFASIGRNANFNLGITDRNLQNRWPATILSYEGFGKDLIPKPISFGLQVPYQYNGPTVLDPGARITMAVTAPSTPGTYYLVDDETFQNTPQPQPFALATIQVTGAPATVPAPKFTPTGRVPQIYRAKPDHYRTFTWSDITSGKSIAFAINGGLFPMNPIVTLQAGQVEQWLLVNDSPTDHAFHIHQQHFAVISTNPGPTGTTNAFVPPPGRALRYASLRDTINIPPGGSVTIRFRVATELGKYVFHCHILPHEDAGMMMAVLGIPSSSDRRIALGSAPGQPSAVFVKNGNGGSVGRITGPAGSRGGVVTATGELTNDLTEDTVVGTPGSGRSPATVSVYDGKTLRQIARFRPFPDFPQAGVSVATGNIDGPVADIIVGRVGPGPSLVRIFSAKGRLLRTIKGTIPGPLPNGVTVASADLNGDNYDDVAIGAGRGTQSRPLTPLRPSSGLGAQDAAARVLPRVVVLDGYQLLNRSVPPRKVFSFVAAGGPGSGVNLAAGYYDPRTRPGLLANLITTPQTGRLAGTVQVWAPPFEAPHLTPALIGDPTVPGADPADAAKAATDVLRHGGNAGAWSQSSDLLLYCTHFGGRHASPQFAALARRLGLPATDSTSPRRIATLHPLGQHPGTGLNIAVTHLGKQGLDALAAWTDPRNPVYTSIDSNGVVSTIRTPTP